MMYLISRETGSYSDYSMMPLCVTSSKSKALAEQKRLAKEYKKFDEEMDKMHSKFGAESDAARGRYCPDEEVKFPDRDHEKAYEIDVRWTAAMNAIKEKYAITENHCYDAVYRIDEVSEVGG